MTPAVLRSAAKTFGTPLYVYDGDALANHARKVARQLNAFELLYAVKANPASAVLQCITGNGFGADVASLAEFRTAISAGCDPRRIIFGGPGKTADECREIIANRLLVSLESAQEISLLDAEAARAGMRAQVLLRINTSHRPKNAGEYMAGGQSQFGIDEEAVTDVWQSCTTNTLDLFGIHAHVASQVLDPTAMIGHYARTASIAVRIMQSLNLPLRVINFGGGLGIPYGPDEGSIDLVEFGIAAHAAIRSVHGIPSDQPRFQLELGRLLVANFGTYLCTIRDVKLSRGRRFVIVDSGFGGFSRPVMPWAQQHQCRVVDSQQSANIDVPTTIVGRSCLPGDVVCKEVTLPEVKTGDLIAVENAGAYGMTMSAVLWGSHISPREVLIANGETLLLSDLPQVLQSSLRPG